MNKRQERYRRNREKELAAANLYYRERKAAILKKRREKYKQNIGEERRKLRERQRARRARLKQAGQSDTAVSLKSDQIGSK